MLARLIRIFKNKYVIVSVAFFAWLLIFDKNNIISQIDLNNKLNQLKSEKEFYVSEIKENRVESMELLTNPENLEKFARERYLMKRDSEDIFLIVRPEDSIAK